MSTPTQSAAPSDSGYMQNQHKVFDVAQGLSVVQWPPPAVFLASVTFHWPLTHVSMLLDEECLSEVFTAAGFKWRLKFKPKGSGKQTSVDECFSSFHVENVEAAKGEKGPLASFSLGTSTSFKKEPTDDVTSLLRRCDQSRLSRAMRLASLSTCILKEDLRLGVPAFHCSERFDRS